MRFDKLHIFTQTGHTYTFQDGVVTTDNESVLVFNYTAMSDGRQKRGVFDKRSMAGYSILESQYSFHPLPVADTTWPKPGEVLGGLK